MFESAASSAVSGSGSGSPAPSFAVAAELQLLHVSLVPALCELLRCSGVVGAAELRRLNAALLHKCMTRAAHGHATSTYKSVFHNHKADTQQCHLQRMRLGAASCVHSSQRAAHLSFSSLCFLLLSVCV